MIIWKFALVRAFVNRRPESSVGGQKESASVGYPWNSNLQDHAYDAWTNYQSTGHKFRMQRHLIYNSHPHSPSNPLAVILHSGFPTYTHPLGGRPYLTYPNPTYTRSTAWALFIHEIIRISRCRQQPAVQCCAWSVGSTILAVPTSKRPCPPLHSRRLHQYYISSCWFI